MSEGKEPPGCVLVFVMATAMIGTGMAGRFGGYTHGVFTERQRAIEAGVACWVIDAKTGERTFKYGAEGKDHE